MKQGRNTTQEKRVQYIRYYNTQRVQRNLGVLTPLEKHNLFLAA